MLPKYRPWTTPAAPASAEPMKKVSAIVRLMSTPISWAASRSCAVDAHRPPDARPADEQLQRDHQRRPTTTIDEDVDHADADAEDVDSRRRRDDLGRVDRRRAVEDLDDVLQDERDADGGDQRREARRVAQRPVGEPLDGDARGRPCTGIVISEVDARGPRPARAGRRSARLAEDVGQDEDRHEGADHEDVAVGEVDELDDAVDHRVAEGDEGVDRADRQAR